MRARVRTQLLVPPMVQFVNTIRRVSHELFSAPRERHWRRAESRMVNKQTLVTATTLLRRRRFIYLRARNWSVVSLHTPSPPSIKYTTPTFCCIVVIEIRLRGVKLEKRQVQIRLLQWCHRGARASRAKVTRRRGAIRETTKKRDTPDGVSRRGDARKAA